MTASHISFYPKTLPALVLAKASKSVSTRCFNKGTIGYPTPSLHFKRCAESVEDLVGTTKV